MSPSLVAVEFDPPLATLFLDRPEVLNAYNEQLLSDLEQGLQSIYGNNNIKTFLITGRGNKAFSVGADIDWLEKLKPRKAREISRLGHRICNMIEENSKVAIAAVNGYALGGGMEIALACDMRIASTRARFGQPEVSLGMTPAFAATQRLPRLIGVAWAKELLYTGNIIDAEEALEKGLVNRVVTPRDLLGECRDLAAEISDKSCQAIGLIKGAINRGLHKGTEKGTDYEESAFQSCFEDKIYRNKLQDLKDIINNN